MISLDSTVFRPGFADRIERQIALARAAILWERVWPALWPASGIVGAFIAAALLGILAWLPAGLQVLTLLSVLGASGYFLYRNFQGFHAPDWHDGARRMERDSALTHRPITERGDRLLIGTNDEIAETLWRAHRRALLERADRLKLALPRSTLAMRDAYALRFAVLVLLLAGFVVAGSDWSRRLTAAFSLAGHGAPTATLDAWIDPPAYTGEAPIYLPHGDQLKPIAVPAGSSLALRVHGAQTLP